MTRPRNLAPAHDSQPPTTRRCGRGAVQSCRVAAYDERDFEVRPSQPVSILDLIRLREASHPEKVFIPAAPALPRPRGLRRGGRDYDETPTLQETPRARRRAATSGRVS